MAKSRPAAKMAAAHQKPAAARSAAPKPAALSDRAIGLNEQAISVLIRELGGRDALAALLTVAGGSPEIATLAALLSDEPFRTQAIGALCTRAGITIVEFFLAVGKAKQQRAILLAQSRIADGIVQVVDDVMTRSAPQDVPCGACQGLGTVPPPGGGADAAPVPCGGCRGTGRTSLLPDLDRQKVALDLAKLLPKAGGGPMVAVQNNFANGGRTGPVVGGIEQLQQAVNEALFARPALPAARSAAVDGSIDGEVCEPPPPEGTVR